MAASDIAITVREREGVTVIDLPREVDATADGAIEAAYADASGRDSASILLNFEGSEYINSTGIALIVGVLARARAERRRITACGLSDHYREIFEITRLADFLTIVSDEESGVRGAS